MYNIFHNITSPPDCQHSPAVDKICTVINRLVYNAAFHPPWLLLLRLDSDRTTVLLWSLSWPLLSPKHVWRVWFGTFEIWPAEVELTVQRQVCWPPYGIRARVTRLFLLPIPNLQQNVKLLGLRQLGSKQKKKFGAAVQPISPIQSAREYVFSVQKAEFPINEGAEAKYPYTMWLPRVQS